MHSIELFSGCGGLALGLSRAGFHHRMLVECDADAVETVQHNRSLGLEHVRDWPLASGDVRDVDWSRFRGEVDMVAGGPPCQPFGIGGKKRGHEDHRDMWPEAVRAVREAQPTAFVFENVRNLAGPKFRGYLEWILECLRRPGMPRRNSESHAEHIARLRAARRRADYQVAWQIVNAADYGAPQIRNRVIIQGLAAAKGIAPAPLVPTHSRDRLLWDQWVTGDYWRRHGIQPRARPYPSSDPNDKKGAPHRATPSHPLPDRADASRVARLRKMGLPPPGLPWVTLRDAIADLGEPDGRRGHVFQPGARSYAGHTGSPLDMPSKALKAGDHGVPGGENMIRFPDGSVRYLTMREAARLVGLPDGYAFPRSWTETMRQLGNAVPSQLAQAAGEHMRRQIGAGRQRSLAIAAE